MRVPAGRRVGVLLAGCVLAAGVVVAVVAVAAGDWPYRALGSSDPGPLVRLGTPLVRLAADASATLCVGALVFAAFFTRPDPRGTVAPLGYAALRTAGRCAAVWLVAALAMVAFDAADTAGLPLRRVLSPSALAALLDALEGPRAWLVTAAVVLLVVAGCRVSLRWLPGVVTLALAVLALLPPLVTAHTSADTGHDVATSALLLHVPAAVLWLGTLLALARPAWRRALPAARLLRRYRRLAAACWLLLAVSGLVDAVVLVPADALLSTGYGLLVAGKVVLLAALGLLGVRLRRTASVARLLAGELAVLVATFAVSVSLTHLPPPALVGRAVSPLQTLLGYDLAGPPTPARLALDWRVDPLFGLLTLALAVGYLVGLRRLRRAGGSWPAGRTVAWLAGCGVLAVATCSGVARYSAAMFSVHMAAHMLLGMLAPVLLACGAPLTLAERVLPAADPPGAAEWLAAVRGSAAVRVLTHPFVAAAVFAAAPFAVYFSPVVDLAARFHWAHVGLDVLFLAVGYLFAWATVGADGTPRPLPNLVRLGVLLAAMPADIVFGAAVMGTHRVIGNGPAGGSMYSALGLPWVGALSADQRVGGGVALALGELSLLVALAALLAGWRRVDAAADGWGPGDYRMLAEALRRRAGPAPDADRPCPPGGSGRLAAGGPDGSPVEAAQPQAVGHHQQRGQGHGATGDQRVEQPGRGDR